MAEIDPTSAIDMIHGKLKKSDPGYFYVVYSKKFCTFAADLTSKVWNKADSMFVTRP